MLSDLYKPAVTGTGQFFQLPGRLTGRKGIPALLCIWGSLRHGVPVFTNPLIYSAKLYHISVPSTVLFTTDGMGRRFALEEPTAQLERST